MLPTYQIPSGPFGVLLNANAGRVTPRLVNRIRHAVGDDHVFLTESPDHAQEVLRTCVAREYPTVFAGGGDGTVIGVINTLHQMRDEAPWLPAVGVLRLGTGNALARWVDSGAPMKTLSDYKAGRMHVSRPLRLIEAEGALFPFGGMGTDAAILNDYEELKSAASSGWMKWLCSGLSGYLMAGLARTLPRYLLRNDTEVTITNLGSPARRIGPGGDEVGDPVPTGGTLYRGACSMLGAATTPLLGYGVRFFPFATRRAGHFHLRIIDMTPFQTTVNMPAAMRGTLEHPGCHDFYADRVRVVFSEAMPYQVGGDARGYRKELVLKMSEIPATLIGRA